MSPLDQIRQTLLTVLEDSFAVPDVQAVQQMGVNLSSAVKREGVVIIQNQNVEVLARIVPSLVKAIRLCDSAGGDILQLSPPALEPSQALVIDHVDYDPIEICCAELYRRGIGWEEMQDLMKDRYRSYVMEHLPTGKDAAMFLKIQPSYLSKLVHSKGA